MWEIRRQTFCCGPNVVDGPNDDCDGQLVQKALVVDDVWVLYDGNLDDDDGDGVDDWPVNGAHRQPIHW